MNFFSKHQTPKTKHQQSSRREVAKNISLPLGKTSFGVWSLKVLWCLVFGIWCFSEASASVYEVGPHKKLSALSQVPWESLNAGDEVHIFWRETPYKEKFVICRQGRADAPIIVRGIPGPKGELPVIDGENATTRTNLNYWGDIRGVIKVGGATIPADTTPRDIIIENLDIHSARPPLSFKAANGEQKIYNRNAAAIYVEKAENLIVRNCLLHDTGNGFFVSSNDQRASTNILVEGCYIFDNGTPGSGQEHNVYTEANGITFQFNRFGKLKEKSVGNNLKDRSANTIIRYNRFEDGNNVIDLVDAEGSKIVRAQPLYGQAFIYGNIIIKPAKTAHGYIVHFDGDSQRGPYYRRGPLYFFNNTVVTDRYGWIIFRCDLDDVKCYCRNNIFYSVQKRGPKALCSISNNRGQVFVSHNWFSERLKPCANINGRCNVVDDGTSIVGLDPGFMNATNFDFRLTASSPCVNRGTNLWAEILPKHDVLHEYVVHQGNQARPRDGKIDLGAFEFFQTKK